MTETESADEAEVQDEGWVSAEEAMQAAEEEMERQIAAASGGSEADGPTSVTEAQETPEEPLLGEAGGDGDGSGGSEEADDLSADLLLGGDDGTDEAGLLTPEQLGEAGGSEGALDEQLEDVGGGTGGGVPGMGDLGGAQPSSQPSVADGDTGTVVMNDDGSTTTTTHHGGVGPDEDGVTETTAITVHPETGETTTEHTTVYTDGSSRSVLKRRQGETIASREMTTDPSGRSITIYSDEGGLWFLEKDPNGNTRSTTIPKDGPPETTTDPGFTPATTEDPGPDGGEEVPGGRNEENQEDLEEMAGPTDAGPGDVDPAEHDDGTGGGEEAQGPQPGVDNPPDEGEPTGGGEPVDDSGWAVTPSEEDDWGREKGPEQSPADAFDAPRPVLDADDVVPGGDAEPQHTTTARPTVAEPTLSPFLQPRPGTGRGGTSDDLRERLAGATDGDDPEGARLAADEPLLSSFLDRDTGGGRSSGDDSLADRLARTAADTDGDKDPTPQPPLETVEADINLAGNTDPTSAAGRSIIEELSNPVDAVFARSRTTSPSDQDPADERAPQPGDDDWVEGPGEWVDGVWVPSERAIGEPPEEEPTGEGTAEEEPEDETTEEPEPVDEEESEYPEEPYDGLDGWPEEEPQYPEESEDLSDNTGDDGGRGAAFNSDDGHDSLEPLSNAPLTRAESDDGGDLFG